MKSRPILFSAPMVRALINGSKTQTRRPVKPQPEGGLQHGVIGPLNGDGNLLVCKYGQPGDQLWVRETWRLSGENGEVWEGKMPETKPDGWDIVYRANVISHGYKYTPSIFMRRWASRILLEIVSVRVERLNDISEADAMAEGVTDSFPESECNSDNPYRDGYRDIWEAINGPGSWLANPWVWVIEFKRVAA